jgi:hypothetical protein
MAKAHNFNFDGGERLSKIGATWFVSYLFYNKRDKTHFNWNKVGHKSRISVFNRTGVYHSYWLQEILNMNDKKLDTNEIELTAEQVKQMARILLNPENSNTTGGSK